MLILGSLSATGATYKFIEGATDWTKSESYSTKLWENVPSDKLPGKDDTVYVTVPEIAIDASDAEVWATINDFGGIAMWYTNSTLVVNVPESGATLDIPLAYKKFNSTENFTRGGIVKRGPGKLKLKSPGEYDYVCNISVEEGDVELQTIAESKKYHYGKLSVAEGSRVFLPVSEPDGNGVRTATTVYLWGLSGKGTITNFVEQTLNVSGPFHTVFEGDIWHKAKLQVAANVDILSENLGIAQVAVHSADFTGNTYLYNPEYEHLAGERKCDPAFGVSIFGNADETSSIGTNGTITLGCNPGNFNSGGGVRYLGSGEKTTKNFSVPYSQERPAHIDGGPNGGLEIAGEISVAAHAWQRLVFKGENITPCKFTGTVKQEKKNGTNYNFYVTKQGSGTWKFEGIKGFTGGFAVEDGTLMFDSLDEAGVSTSLGDATVLTKDVYGILHPGIFEPYAYVLGGVGSDGLAKGKGLLEYTGVETVRVTTRPAKVNGKGGFANSTGKSFRFADISAMRIASGDTLVLSGSGTGGNEVQDLSGDLSVVKEGEGTWVLSGSNTFSGTIEVKGGTLHVRDPAKYTWYRWVICEAISNNQSRVDTCEFGLYDANGRRVNAGLRKGSSSRKLAPGEAHIDSGRVLVEFSNSYLITNAFDDTTASARFHIKDITPKYDDENTWIPFLMRLPDGVNDVASYDFTVRGKKAGYHTANVKIWKVDASSDGLRWDELVPVTTNTEMKDDYSNWWRFAKNADGGYLEYETAGSAAEHSGGAPLAGRKVSGILPVLNNVSSVSVAPGAVLSTDRSASPVTLHSLAVDATGAGTIRNFAFAENGVLNVTNLPGVSGEVLLPGEYDNVSGFANVAGWTLNVNGAPASKLTVSVRGGRIYVQPVGFVFVVR